jgi:hypothetical protein
MQIDLIRTQFGNDATNGLLFIDGKFECYTLEDQYQAVKVMHETCIPEGSYEIKFRKVGGFHQRYSERYKNAHYGMLWLQDVPEFEYILIHSGNTDEHTSGCILVGNTQQDLDLSKDGMVGQSRKAYEKMYRKVSAVLLQGKKVTINISKINLGPDNKAKDHVINISEMQKLIDEQDEKLSHISGQLGILLALVKGKNII